ncbi:MAG TPA: hypothetical protein VGP36_13860 [Mycobacteriales bacterium]|nr:hypothetical protein [Mycobacteriales bacterium]
MTGLSRRPPLDLPSLDPLPTAAEPLDASAYLPRNREVSAHLVAGEHDRARAALTAYLQDPRADVERAVAG